MTTLFAEGDVRGCLPEDVDRLLVKLEVLPQVDSTNSRLLEAGPPASGYWHASIADEQTAGRGRGENRWHSAPGAGLWMSIGHTFEVPPAQLTSLTIALGIDLAAEFESLGATGIGIKWPNDLIIEDRKLGGMLVESAVSGKSVVCGIGINFDTPDAAAIDGEEALAPIGLNDALRDPPSRAELAARVIARAAEVLPRFAAEGLAPWTDRWPRYDWLHGQPVRVTDTQPELSGVARGIGDDGSLLIVDGEIEFRVVSGSIRRTAADA